MHSGAGRITNLVMRPMSLFESYDSTGVVSLKKLFENPDRIEGKTNKKLEDLFFLICRGGWPKAINQESKIALAQSRNFYKMLVQSDISKVDNITRKEDRVISLMRSLSRNIGTPISLIGIKKEAIRRLVWVPCYPNVT